MRFSKRALMIPLISLAVIGVGGGAAYAAGANPHPSPSGTPTQLPSIPGVPSFPTASPSPTVSQLPIFPRVNPLRGCRLTQTDELTFVPQLRQWNIQAEPSITCVDRDGDVHVYVLQR